jgi:hypothetical protein
MAAINRKLNVIWIVVDGARNYHTGIDDRDRIDVMDRMRSEAVDFTHAVTSAPSSALSAAAMMTGMDCAYIARHFSDFRFDPQRIASAPVFLRSHGYQITTIHDSHEGRQIMKDLILPLPYPCFPRGISHGEWWSNREIMKVLKHQFATGRVREPAFFLIWYDVRRDPTISDLVTETINLFKEQGLYDNAMFIMCSDHGYPDPSTGLTEQTMKQYSHDMIITDDNILVPLLMHYPGSPAKSVSEIVGTVDIFPTMLEVLDVEGREEICRPLQGRSLVPLIEGRTFPSRRVFRIDTRLELASGRITAMRSDSYKYVFYHDSGNEELFDLSADPHEMHDVIGQPGLTDVAEEYRGLFRQSQQAVDAFHLDELADNYEKNVGKLWPRSRADRVRSIGILTRSPALFLEHLVRSFRRTFPNATIDYVVNHTGADQDDVGAVGFDNIVTCDDMTRAGVEAGLAAGRLRPYDLAVVTTENSRSALDALDMDAVRLFRGRRLALIDYNMRVYSRFLRKWIWPFRQFIDQWEFYRYEPKLVLKDIGKMVKSGVASRLLGRKPVALDAEWAKMRRDKGK